MGSAGKLLPEQVLLGWGRCAPWGSERRWQGLPLEPRQETHHPWALYVYTLHMHSVCTTYAPHVHYKYAIHDIYAICALHVHLYNRDTIYALYMHYIGTIGAVYSLHINYIWTMHTIAYIYYIYICTIYTLYGHYMYTTQTIYMCNVTHICNVMLHM